MISSTVTRPTTIAPTSVQHVKLHVLEVIDIATLPSPKPIIQTMETSQRKEKPKSGEGNRTMPQLSSRSSKSSRRHSTNGIPLAQTTGQQTHEGPLPQSPVRSEPSSSTAGSSSGASSGTYHGEPRVCDVQDSTEDIKIMSNPNSISVKSEVLQAGCLAGNALPLKITIKHDKPFKSMQGIVITLYRQGRIDTHPALPLGTSRNCGKRRYEDYYPKSRTGLGGLSLSSAGSSRSFRQDLNQIFVPIIIDPHSLTALINTSIQAPADLFPSITNVPGAMVSFKYFVEIVVDLRGKLSGQDRILPHLSMTNTPQHGFGDPKVSRCEGENGVNYLSTPGFNYLITDQLRRTRGVICNRTEVMIGTRDSARRRGKFPDRRKTAGGGSLRSSMDLSREEGSNLSRDGNGRWENINERPRDVTYYAERGNPPRMALIPTPEPEEELDEKTQMRKAEERLLPSAPPQDENTPSPSIALMPSAPPAIDEEDFIDRYHLRAPAPAYDGPSRAHTNIAHRDINGVGSSHSSGTTASPQDDKQELERQRLLALASAPDYADLDGSDGATNEPRVPEPTAPVLFQDDIFSIHDPRIPESSPNDFIDDRIPPSEQLCSSESSAPNVSARNNHTDHDYKPSEPRSAEGSDEDHLRNSKAAESMIPPDAGGVKEGKSNKKDARDDVGVLDENTSQYSR